MSRRNRRIESLSRMIEEGYGTQPALQKYGARVAQGLRIWEETVIREVFPETGTVAVVGCGAGRELFAIQARGFSACGLDISRALLRHAWAMATDMARPARLTQIDGKRLPLGDLSVDVVTLWSQLLGNVPGGRQRRHLLTEAHRALRPGGTTCFSVHDSDRTLPMLDLAKTAHWDEPEPGDFLLDEEDEQTTRYWHYFRADEVADLCRDAGFAGVDVCHTSDLGERWDNVLVAVATK